MRKFFYASLALDGMKKNKRLYLPYILTCSGMIMMAYIMNFLACADFTDIMYGVDTVREMFRWGSIVIAVFSCIFLFYTNSFLMKNRKKEFGLYSVLGMGKGNIGKVLLWENIMVLGISLIAGFATGIGFSKLAELLIINLIKGKVTYGFEIPMVAVTNVLWVYGIIFALLFFNGLRQIKFSNTVTLLKSERAGEKPLKANWLMGVLGAILLGTGYILAVTVKDPVTALVWFFIAVLLVILGTYFVMIFGSVLLCRVLQKNKKFYYNKAHFVSVSSMAYRMKRNGAGLASICILITMILVTVSSTTSLYFGLEGTVDNRFTKQFNAEYRMIYAKNLEKKNIDKINQHLNEEVEKNGAEITSSTILRSVDFVGGINGNVIKPGVGNLQLYVIPLDDYNHYAKEERKLNDDEVFLINMYGNEYSENTIEFPDEQKYKVKEVLEEKKNPVFSPMMLKGMTLVVPDFSNRAEYLEQLDKENDAALVQFRYGVNFDTNLTKAEQEDFQFAENLYENKSADCEYFSMIPDGRVQTEAEVYGLYGGLLGLGIMMSIIFAFTAVLIVYYKQITEGYEDQSRFEIMQKVGMTKKEIKKSINSQLLIVFFLPIIFAGMHLAFAFPMIKLILKMMYLSNAKLFAFTTMGCFAIFALLYAVIYKITSNAYYRIVSGAK